MAISIALYAVQDGRFTRGPPPRRELCVRFDGVVFTRVCGVVGRFGHDTQWEDAGITVNPVKRPPRTPTMGSRTSIAGFATARSILLTYARSTPDSAARSS